jgi:hypothetical protein
MSVILRFLAWLAGQVWRYGKTVVNKITTWAKNNWKTVAKWIASGVAFEVIVARIKKALGIK